MADNVWMTHPSVPGSLAQVPDFAFTNYWSTRGWVSAAAPTGTPLRDEFVSPAELSVALTGLSAPAALQTWRSALANRDYATAHVWLVGDSNAEGHGATLMARTLARRLAPTINKRRPLVIGAQPTGGRGFVPCGRQALSPSDAADGVANTGGAVSIVAGYGVNGMVCSQGSTHKQVYTVSGSHFQIAYTGFTAGGTGTLYYKIDAGGQVTINTGTSNVWGGLSSVISLGTPGAHTVEVGWSAGANVLLNGIIEYYGDSASGVVCHNASQQGTFARSWNGTVSNNGLVNASTAATLGAQLVVLCLSINDSAPAAGNRTAAQFRDDMATLYAYYRAQYVAAGKPAPSFVHLFNFQPNGPIVDTGGYAAYLTAALAAAATDANACVLDVTRRLPANTLGASTPGGWYYDNFHLSNLGHAAVADLLADFLIPS